LLRKIHEFRNKIELLKFEGSY